MEDNPHKEDLVGDNVSGHTDVEQVETCGDNSASKVEHNRVSKCSSFKLCTLPKDSKRAQREFTVCTELGSPFEEETKRISRHLGNCLHQTRYVLLRILLIPES